MLLQNKKIAIIGAGPVGLTMATLLQQKGANVAVYERDINAQARIWGGTLDLHENTGQQALKKAGLLEDYFSMAIPMGRNIADEQGNVFFSVKPQYNSPEINRNDLRKLLLNSLSEGTVVWDRKFMSLEAYNGKLLLHFENGPDVIKDVVIGANGGTSAIKKYVTDTMIEDTGTYIIMGEVPQPEISCPEFYSLCNTTILMTAHKGNLLVANSKNNGAITYNIIFKTPDEWDAENKINFQDTESIRKYLLDKLSGWDERYKQLINATSFFLGLPTKKLALNELWATNRSLPVTLVGDAAHLMPPFAGEGVNTGLMDAMVLADNLTNGNFETIEAAINDYENKMFVYAKKAQLETSRNEIEMRSPDFSFKTRFSS